MKRILIFLLFLVAKYTVAQNPYPQDYFRNPLDIPIVLAGTFAELRSNHFHAGMDIKTQRKEGLNVIAAAEGYVSRIKISHWGYGKALYITHPNGYTSVYAHLQKFSPKIEAYIKHKQYENETFEIEVFPKIGILDIANNEHIGFSGNTGGSTAPHLHFELRDKNERPINPMLFGLHVKDTKKPTVSGIYAYAIDDKAHINYTNRIKKIRLIPLQNGNYKAENMTAHGKIGFGIVTTDRLDGALNKNGVSNIKTSSNGNEIFEIDFKRFSFNETKHINRLIDYKYYKEQKIRIQKLFVQANNPLSLYKNTINNGYLQIEDSTNTIYNITIADYNGNKTTVSLDITGKKMDSISNNSISEIKETGNYFLYANQAETLHKDNVSVFLPKHTFYDDLLINFNVNSDTLTLHTPSVPTQKYFSITYNTERYNKLDKDKLFIARLNTFNTTKTYVNTKQNENTLIARTNILGTYTIATDTVSPVINPINFKHKKWISKETNLRVKIKDKHSGIRNYRATINGKWVLMEYEPKKDLLVYNFSDNIITDVEHNFKLIVIDNVGNSSTFEASFFRK